LLLAGRRSDGGYLPSHESTGRIVPVFDISCICGWTADDVFTHHDLPACPQCGGATNKLWKTGSFPGVIDDTYPGGLTVENLGPTPITFESRSDHRAYLKAHGFSPKVQHRGVQGSDKNPHTSRWV
jgi:hypothetical protein